MEDDNNNYDVRSLILQAVEEQTMTKFLELCYFIYEATMEEENSNSILEVINDQEFIRRVKQLEAITEDAENKIYYYEDNNYSPSKLAYRENLERTIRTVRNEELKKLALILRMLNEEEEIAI